MSAAQSKIVFVDNTVNRILKTTESLKQVFGDIRIFNRESEFVEFLEKEKADVVFINLDLQPNDAVILIRDIKHLILPSDPFIVVYTDKQDDFVQELAFNTGADSFINFHNKAALMELFIRNLLRRKIAERAAPGKELVIDTETYLIHRNGKSFQLPRKEFRIFQLLFNNADKYISKQQIASLIWEDESIARKRTIDVHVYNIRQNLGKGIIQSRKGKGYKINRKLLK